MTTDARTEFFRFWGIDPNAPEAEKIWRDKLRMDAGEFIGSAPMVRGDIQPYRSVAVDKETGKRVNIESRRQHREFLARNDLVEVGNDFIPPKRLDDGPADAPMLSVEEMKKQGFVEEAF